MTAADPVRLTGDGVFAGYASLFGVPDLVGDVVEPGAFRATLARRGSAGVKLLWQHIATEPLGRWLAIEEDAKGLRVTGRIHAGIARGREVRSLVEAGILDGLSIGFRTVRARTDPRTGLRHVTEVDLWEISIVTFPMLPGARIAPQQKSVPPVRPRPRRAGPVTLSGAGPRRVRFVHPRSPTGDFR
jgi:HK97 family phage prohead protease